MESPPFFLRDSRSLVLSSSASSIPLIISFKRSWSPADTLLHQPLLCKEASPKREPTFYPFEIDVEFGCFGKFLDFCLHLDNRQNWEGQKTSVGHQRNPATQISRRFAPLTVLMLSTSLSELVCFVGELDVFLIYDGLKFCRGRKKPPT